MPNSLHIIPCFTLFLSSLVTSTTTEVQTSLGYGATDLGEPLLEHKEDESTPIIGREIPLANIEDVGSSYTDLATTSFFTTTGISSLRSWDSLTPNAECPVRDFEKGIFALFYSDIITPLVIPEADFQHLVESVLGIKPGLYSNPAPVTSPSSSMAPPDLTRQVSVGSAPLFWEEEISPRRTPPLNSIGEESDDISMVEVSAHADEPLTNTDTRTDRVSTVDDSNLLRIPDHDYIRTIGPVVTTLSSVMRKLLTYPVKFPTMDQREKIVYTIYSLYANVSHLSRWQSEHASDFKKVLEQLHYRSVLWLGDLSVENAKLRLGKLIIVLEGIENLSSASPCLVVDAEGDDVGKVVLELGIGAVIETAAPEIPQAVASDMADCGATAICYGLRRLFACCYGSKDDVVEDDTSAVAQPGDKPPLSLEELELIAKGACFTKLRTSLMTQLDKLLVEIGKVAGATDESAFADHLHGARANLIMDVVFMTHGLLSNGDKNIDTSVVQAEVDNISRLLVNEVPFVNRKSVADDVKAGISKFRNAIRPK